jgi:hypothetical protein
LPLFRAPSIGVVQSLPLLEPEIAGGMTALKVADRVEKGERQRGLITA